VDSNGYNRVNPPGSSWLLGETVCWLAANPWAADGAGFVFASDLCLISSENQVIHVLLVSRCNEAMEIF
jgi:hypothetical protein